ncbi:Required for respiratory growth protein 9, mitochondrial [Tolypocladium ophioglossoides CBS 100239]|uniref:Required for respiratory growth protein 9, mitochondrial n=1 Tax=Tolypocladium ophioglossoides (strain CBS 100239) TaxID=1163406 RepID=A0A0L0NJ89_TOLOC|nr:Required for respiratory growth protein 9, mitochondrial [Tolypocladium ophioglossoides CBS 100239]
MPRAAVHGGLLAAPRRERGFCVSARQRQDAGSAAAAVASEAVRDAPGAAEAGHGLTASPQEVARGQESGEPQQTTRRAKPQDDEPGDDEPGDDEPGGNASDARLEAAPSNLPTPQRARKPKLSVSDLIKTPSEELAPEPKPQGESWQTQKAALKKKFPDGWKPRKRLSPDALAGIRALNAQFPDVYTTQALADKFEVSSEAIRRILKSKWQPSVDEEQERQERWFRRGKQVWEQKAALGVKPPKRWRREGIVRDPAYHEWSRKASEREREWEEDETRRYREGRARSAQGGRRTGK